MIFICAFIIYIKRAYDQTLVSSIDALLLSIATIIFMIIDGATKGEDYFDQMLEDLPYLKKKKYNDLESSIGSLLSYQEEDPNRRCKTDLEEK
jgi:hypothetical protein